MLGAAQERWLSEPRHARRWTHGAARPQPPYRMTVRRPRSGRFAWDGYPAARQRLLRFIQECRPRSGVVITGDTHVNDVCDLKPRLRRRAGRTRRDGAVGHVRDLDWPIPRARSSRSCATTPSASAMHHRGHVVVRGDPGRSTAAARRRRATDPATGVATRGRLRHRGGSSRRRTAPRTRSSQARPTSPLGCGVRASGRSRARGLDVRESLLGELAARDVVALFRIVGVVAGVSHEIIGAPPQLADEHLGTASDVLLGPPAMSPASGQRLPSSAPSAVRSVLRPARAGRAARSRPPPTLPAPARRRTNQARSSRVAAATHGRAPSPPP